MIKPKKGLRFTLEDAFGIHQCEVIAVKCGDAAYLDEMADGLWIIQKDAWKRYLASGSLKIPEKSAHEQLDELISSNAARQARLVERRKDAGLVRVSVWVHQDRADELRKIAKTMEK